MAIDTVGDIDKRHGVYTHTIGTYVCRNKNSSCSVYRIMIAREQLLVVSSHNLSHLVVTCKMIYA